MKYWLIGLAVVAALLLALDVFIGPLNNWAGGSNAARFTVELLSGPVFYATVGVLVLVALFAKRGWGRDSLVSFGFVLLAGAGSFGISFLVKEIVGRARPFEQLEGIMPLLQAGSPESFPSSHTALVFGIVFGLLLAAGSRSRALAALGLLGMASGIARVAAGIHWGSDILGSILLAFLVSYVLALFLWKKEKISHPVP